MTSQSHKPLKPDRQSRGIIFTHSGEVFLAEGALPRVKDDLEVAVGEQFASALDHFQGIRLRDVRAGVEPADIECVGPQGRLGIQVTELIDNELRTLQTMRESYAARLREAYPRILRRFRGHRVCLCDVGDPPYLPKIGTPKGEKCAEEMARWLSMLADEIRPGGPRLVRNHPIGPDAREITAIVEPLGPSAPGDAGSLSWSGAGPSRLVDEPEPLLKQAVARKMRKHYPKPEMPFWLLVYSTESPILENEPSVMRTRALLSRERHPFDCVWFFHPPCHGYVGHVLRIWPAATDAGRG